MHSAQQLVAIQAAYNERVAAGEQLLRTDNDLPVLPLVGDLVTGAELGEAGASHDENDDPGHILLVRDVHLVLAMPASISTTAMNIQ